MAQIIELGGKSYRAIEVSTVEHDFTVMQLLVEPGWTRFQRPKRKARMTSRSASSEWSWPAANPLTCWARS